MSSLFEELLSEFPRDDFVELKKLPEMETGGLVIRINLDPIEVFDLLEVIYGNYEDLLKGHLFIDNKSNWERSFQTPDGVLRIYDFKGSTSIGYSGVLTPVLTKRAEVLKEAVEKFWERYIAIKSDLIKEWVRENPLSNFTHTFYATHRLLEKAEANGSDLETLVLYASIVDAQLRFGIILSTQIEEKTEDYDRALVFQDGKSYIREREIFELALKKEVISEELFLELSNLYDFRNKAVHRYFISDFEYGDIKNKLGEYKIIYTKISDKLRELEQIQVEKEVGMTKKENLELDDLTVKNMMKIGQGRIDSSKPIAIIPKRKRLFPEQEE